MNPSELQMAPHLGGVDFLARGPGSESVRFPLDFAAAEQASPTVRTLEALWFEERLIEIENGYRLSAAELYRLDLSESLTLELPALIAPIKIELRTQGYAGSQGFKVEADLRHPQMGLLPPDARQGPLLTVGDQRMLVPESALELLDLVNRGAP
jgi:hypothetical protein